MSSTPTQWANYHGSPKKPESSPKCGIEPMEDNPLVLEDCCSTVKVCPPIIMDPERSLPLFGKTWKVTVALPEPEDGLVSVTHSGSTPTVH